MPDQEPTTAESSAAPSRPPLRLEINGNAVEVPDADESLLAVLRERLLLTSVKDGCSPQGQCGCCTVLVDGKPRVACVTPARRVRGRSIQTLEGLPEDRRDRWGQALCAAGGSQCGFCTPGIVMRLESTAKDVGAQAAKAGIDDDAVRQATDRAVVNQALLAHLCRCTGWQTIHEAWDMVIGDDGQAAGERVDGGPEDRLRNLDDASTRATIEGRAPQVVSPGIALGQGGFAADTGPADALVAVLDEGGNWVVGETLTEARANAGKVQGRRTTASHRWPLDVPEGEWAARVRTTWVDGAYLETDASWCRPGEEPSTVVANGGAFGSKADGEPTGSGPWPLDVRGAARRLADANGRPVLALASREDVAARGPKRPPVAGGIRADGTGILRVVTTPGIEEVVASVAPGLVVEQVDVAGPPTSLGPRAAGWAEAVVLAAGATGAPAPVHSPDGAVAEATIEDGVIKVTVGCGRVLDPVVLRSYCIGAAHMAWSWLTSEAMLVDADGVVHDLTVRSFGVLRAIDTPSIEVDIVPGEGQPVNGSDAVFAAVAAAGWLAKGCPPDWPVG